ncbi:MAG: hypothetical protein A3E87_00315 [Gammaproteobacteria bacterium RIFCSPHIGHO2_12_FULL_35_23]|nr:MAG: hypothetical protein A3E87_00315 [Gammaproteobacteria bacterium RIFCSPHIGHO2_12_FULL_35_23]
MDRSAISYAIQSISTEFHLSNTAFGLLSSMFAVGYILFSSMGGLVADSLGARKTLSCAAFAWSVICILMGLTSVFWLLVIWRLLLGVAESPSFPSLTRFIADHISTQSRAKTLSITLAVVPFASALGAPVITTLLRHYNWQLTYIFLGSAGMVVAVLWGFCYRIKRTSSSLQHQPIRWRAFFNLLKNKPIMANNIAFFAYGYLLFFSLSWLPAFLLKMYHLDLKSVGWLLSLPWLFATIALIMGGFLSDYLYNKTKSLRIARSHLIWVAQLLSVCSLLPIIYYHRLDVTMVCLCLALSFCLFPNAIAYSLNIDLAPKNAAASLGLMNTFFALAGILAPILTGKLVDLTGNFNSAFYLVIGITLIAIMSVLCWQTDAKIANNSLA